MKQISGRDLQKETKGTDKLTLVDFSADWCAPCKMLHPVLDQLTKELSDKVRFLTIDVDRDQMVANQLGIRGVPTMIVYHGGKEIDRMVGFRDKASLKRALESLAAGVLQV